MNKERIHEIGVERHKDRWLFANRRAIEAASAAGMNYSGAKEKIAIPAIVLKVLDGQMMDTGFRWNHEVKRWIPLQAIQVADRLLGREATG